MSNCNRGSATTYGWVMSLLPLSRTSVIALSAATITCGWVMALLPWRMMSLGEFAIAATICGWVMALLLSTLLAGCGSGGVGKA